MTVHIYKYTCLTNLHVGSGDVNYNIIDNEVERDPITNYPMIHASGVKGAMREHFSGLLSEETVNRIFGAPPKHKEAITAGSYKFLDAKFLSRPMRLGGDTDSSAISVVSLAAVNDYLRQLTAFGANHYGISEIRLEEAAFGDNQFLTNHDQKISIEGEATDRLPDETAAQLKKLSDVLGEFFAVAKDIDQYQLPVMARNYLENGVSKNLWYEEVVPHGSVFYQMILTPDGKMDLDLESGPIQFGGNASIGCGYIRIEKLGGTV
jgi:CRISPR-associated protein Cmr4